MKAYINSQVGAIIRKGRLKGYRLPTVTRYLVGSAVTVLQGNTAPVRYSGGGRIAQTDVEPVHDLIGVGIDIETYAGNIPGSNSGSCQFCGSV